MRVWVVGGWKRAWKQEIRVASDWWCIACNVSNGKMIYWTHKSHTRSPIFITIPISDSFVFAFEMNNIFSQFYLLEHLFSSILFEMSMLIASYFNCTANNIILDVILFLSRLVSSSIRVFFSYRTNYFCLNYYWMMVQWFEKRNLLFAMNLYGLFKQLATTRRNYSHL